MKNFKKILSGVLAVAMMLTQVGMPVTAFADALIPDVSAISSTITTPDENLLDDSAGQVPDTPPASPALSEDDASDSTDSVNSDAPASEKNADVEVQMDEEELPSPQAPMALSLEEDAPQALADQGDALDNNASALALGGARIVTQNASGGKGLELVYNGGAVTYGDSYTPGGFVVYANGFESTDIPAIKAALADNTFSMEVVRKDSSAQRVELNSETPAGSYNVYVSASRSSVSVGDVTGVAVTSGKDATTGIVTVNTRHIVVIPDAKSKTYGEYDPTFSWQLEAGSSLAPQDTQASFTGQLGRDNSGESFEQVGFYNINKGTLANPNYSIEVKGDNKFEIKPATIILTAGAKTGNNTVDQNVTREYGDANPIFGFSVNGIVTRFDTAEKLGLDVGKDNCLVQVSCDLGVDTAIPGEYTIRIDGVQTDSLKNYTIVTNNGTLKVTNREILISVADAGKVYGEDDPTFTVTISAAKSNGVKFVADASREATASASGANLMPLSGSITREAGEDVDTYKFVNNYTAAQNPYYNIHFYEDESQFTINTRLLTVSLSAGNSKVYGAENPDFSKLLVYSGWVNETEDLSELDLSGLGFDTTMAKTSGVGNYAVTPKGITSHNYAISSVGAQFAVTKRPVTITLDGKEAVYGDAEKALSWSSDQDQYIKDNALSALRIALTRAPGKDVGEYSITVSNDLVAANPNYDITVANAPVYKITPLAVDVYVNNATKLYGNANPAFSIDLERLAAALVLDDQLSDVGAYDVELSCDADKTSPVNISTDFGINEPNKYPITASGLTGNNYSFVYHAGYLNVTPRDLSITIDAKTSVYGEPVKELTYTVNNAVNGDTVGNGIDGYLYTENTIKNVGTYPILNDFKSPNYKIHCNAADYVVTSRNVTVFPKAASRYYGEENPAFAVDGTNFAPGESVADLTGTAVYTCAAVKTSDVGKYDISVSGLSNPNYTVAFQVGTLTVNARPVTITPEAGQGKVYGEVDPGLDFSITDLVTGANYDSTERGNIVKAGDLAGALDREPGENAGEYKITLGTIADKNYDITFVQDVVFVIEKADLYIRANDQTRLYGEENEEFTYRITGWKFGESLDDLGGKLLVTCTDKDGNTVDAKTPVGKYDIVPSGVTSDNYNILPYKGTLTINARPLTITVEPKVKTYGDADPELTYVLSEALIDPDNSPLTGGLSREAGEDVGRYAITSTLANGNYDITVIPNWLTINQKDLTVTVVDAERLYGEENPTFEVSYSDFAFDEDESALSGTLTFATDAVKTSPVGRYDVAASGLTSQNYNVQFVAGQLTVKARPMTIVVEDKTQVYGEKAEKLSWHLSEELVDENSPIIVALSRDEGVTAGKYGIHAVCVNPNYDITVQEGTYEIVRRPITVIIDDHTSTYGNNVETLTYTLICKLGEALVGDDVLEGGVVTDPEHVKHVGEYAIISTLTNPNYAIAYQPGKYIITVAALETKFADAEKLYGTETEVPAMEFAGWQYDDPENMILPELKVLVADDFAGRKGFAPDTANGVSVYGNVFSFAGVESGDYLYSACNGALSISRLVSHEGMYTVNGSKKSSGVYNSNVTIKAQEGYKLSYSDALEGNTWSDELVVTGDCKDKEVKFFVIRTEDGAITTSVTKTITIDTYVAPAPAPTPAPTPAPVDSNPHTGVGLLANSIIQLVLVLLGGAILITLTVVLTKRKKGKK